MTDSAINTDYDTNCVRTVDARGLRCPLPLLKAKQQLNSLAPGQQLQVLATDSASVKDFHAFVNLSCHRLAAFEQAGEVYRYLLIKGAETE